ncbi:MAG: DNA polymerase III subunit [Acidobacteria bacterium]|nr:DNA polymerase III subunit [Acidobacteriota bacterium]
MPFAQIVGHTRALDLLRRAVGWDSVPQSLLFAGPEGVGKHSAAVALAQAVNCASRRDGDGCGTCNSCRRIAAGTFSDVVVLDKGGEASIKIDALRDRVLGPIGYRPFEGRRRVFIIDPADDLTLQAQDALLKTLEEPPPSAILILVTAYPDSLLATIRSRCRRVRFSALPEDEVVRVLTGATCRIELLEARHRAVLSGGSVSRALAADGREFVDDRDAALGLLASVTERQLPARLKAAAAFAQVDKKRRAREASSTRLALLASLLRDLLVLDVRGRDEIANSDLADQLERLVPSFPAERLVAAFAAVRQAEASLDRNASPKIVADWLAVSL